MAVDVAAGHHEDDFFETTKPRRTGIHEFHAPPLGFGIAGVHAEKVPSKKGRFIAAGTGADFHDDVLFIIGVFRQKEDGQPLFIVFQLRGQFLHFHFGHGRQFLIALSHFQKGLIVIIGLL